MHRKAKLSSANLTAPGWPGLDRREAPVARHGLTLLEVLISIFVLAVGLLSVASLLPVASFQAQRALVNDRKAIVGQSAIREIKARGFLRPELWVNTAGGPLVIDAWGTLNVTGIFGAKWFRPVAIDPLMVAAGAKYTFTAPPFATTMARATLATFGAVNSASSYAAADQACVSQDDLVFDLPSNADAPPTGGFSGPVNGSGIVTPIKRRSEGRYSWMITLSPAYGDLIKNDSRALLIMSVVVFKDRAFNVMPTVPIKDPVSGTILKPAPERAVKVTFNGSTISGGDITITDAAAANLNVNVGDWIMLGCTVTDMMASATQSTGVGRPAYRWYRVVTAAPAAQVSANSWKRNITIAGPDLNVATLLNNNPGTNATVFIYEGAVAVYERAVHLEGPSMWTPPNMQNNLY